MDLGLRIKRAREARGWTQAQLADEVGVSVGTIRNWETGGMSPRNSMGRLTQILGNLGDHSDATASDQSGVLLDLPPSVLEGLTEDERQEVITKAKATAMQAAREIRRHD